MIVAVDLLQHLSCNLAADDVYIGLKQVLGNLVSAKVAPSKSMTNFRRSFRGLRLQRAMGPAKCA